eukprot:4158073-Alexandrium_andersonii.AAC.1
MIKHFTPNAAYGMDARHEGGHVSSSCRATGIRQQQYFPGSSSELHSSGHRARRAQRSGLGPGGAARA